MKIVRIKAGDAEPEGADAWWTDYGSFAVLRSRCLEHGVHRGLDCPVCFPDEGIPPKGTP